MISATGFVFLFPSTLRETAEQENIYIVTYPISLYNSLCNVQQICKSLDCFFTTVGWGTVSVSCPLVAVFLPQTDVADVFFICNFFITLISQATLQ